MSSMMTGNITIQETCQVYFAGCNTIGIINKCECFVLFPYSQGSENITCNYVNNSLLPENSTICYINRCNPVYSEYMFYINDCEPFQQQFKSVFLEQEYNPKLYLFLSVFMFSLTVIVSFVGIPYLIRIGMIPLSKRFSLRKEMINFDDSKL